MNPLPVTTETLEDEQLPATGPRRKTWSVGTLTYTSTGLIVLFCWLLWGDFAFAMKERSIMSVVQLLLKQYHASDLLTGLILATLPGAIGLILCPVISYRSDRCRSRWGRRIPFLLVTTPFVSLGLVGLAVAPRLGAEVHRLLGAHSPGLDFMILWVLGLFWTFYEFGTVAVFAIFNALVNDVVPHAVLGRFFGLFRALSLIAGMIFNFWLLQWAETHFMWIFLGVSALYGVGITLMSLKVKEGEYPPPSTNAQVMTPVRIVRLYFRECFGLSYYRWFYAFATLAVLAFAPINGFSVYFAKSINMDMAAYGKCLAITYGISLVLSYPLGMLVDRLHPLRVGMFSLVIYALVTAWGGFYARTVETFSVALIAHGVISGIYYTATAALGQMLLPKSKFAQYASAWGIIMAFAGMSIGPIVGTFLDATGHNYRLTFLVSCGITVLALFLGFIVLRKIQRMGGLKQYVAPE